MNLETEQRSFSHQEKMDAHVIDWMWWELKKDKVWFWFPQNTASQVIDLKAV